MNQEAQLASLLKGGTKTNAEGSFLATVTAVNGKKIDVVAGDGTEYFDVQLKAAIEDEESTSDMIITPIVGSTVIVSSIEGSNRLYVAMFSEIKDVTFNGGENGMVRIEELIKILNSLKDQFNAHTHQGVSGPTGVPLSQIRELAFGKLADTKILH